MKQLVYILTVVFVLFASVAVRPSSVAAQGTYTCSCVTLGQPGTLGGSACTAGYEPGSCPVCGGAGQPFTPTITLACGPIDNPGIDAAGGFGQPQGGLPGAQNELSPLEPLSDDALNNLNPLFNQNANGNQAFQPGQVTPASLLQRVLVFAFPLSGLILFVMLIWAGFEILSGATNKKSLDAGKNRATAALLGFLLLFASYWIVQIIEVIFNISIISR